jgi:ADP-ribose pyrophosphatase
MVKRLASKTLYRGRVAKLTVDTFKKESGFVYKRETIHHPPSVVILPFIRTNELVLIKQFRHAINRVICEIPAGTSEPGESMLACAKRELAEETGYTASRWTRLIDFYPAPGISTERMTLFVARGLKPLRKRLAMDADESIAPAITPVPKAIQMVKKNQIIDAKSIIGLLWGLSLIRWSGSR